VIVDELHELTALFARLGAPDPESWARSQLEEGIPQLARFVFLREAWKLVVSDGDTQWIGTQQAEALKGNPGASIGPALTRLLSAGAAAEDITTVVRTMQWQLLFSFCYLLEDPGVLEPEISDLAWSLVQVDEDGQPIDVIHSLHESVLDTDPSGRNMGSS
jgi:hypothetical protein